MVKAQGLAVLLLALVAPADLAATTIAFPRQPPPPYTVAEVLPCLERTERDTCLLRLFIGRDGPAVVADWFEVYGDPLLASALGLDLGPQGPLAQASDAAAKAYLRDRQDSPPAQALEPFEPLLISQFGERYIGLELPGLMALVEMGRDPRFPIRERPSAALVAEAQARIETGLRGEEPLTRQQSAEDYINLLLNWDDRTTAARIDALAAPGAPKILTYAPDRVSRLAQVGDLDAAYAAALALRYRSERGRAADRMGEDINNRAVADARDMVAQEAAARGRADIALLMAGRVIEDACPKTGPAHRPTLGLEDALSLLVRLAGPQEAERWLDRVEACSATGDDDDRIDAASAAFHAWLRLGRPERAHRIAEAWRPKDNRGKAEYASEPRGFFVSMLLAEGRVDEAIPLASSEALFGLTKDRPQNVDLIVDRLPAGERFAALMSCEMAMRLSHMEPCATRLEREASTPAEKLEAAGLLIAVVGAGSPGRYGPWAYDVPAEPALIEARFAAVRRLLRNAVEADPQSLAAPIDADDLRELVRKSLRARLWAARAP